MAFNINQGILDLIPKVLEVSPIVYVHGDGTIVINEDGSKYHKEYNSGGSQDEVVSRASYRAIYKRGDKLPKTEKDLEQDFYEQRKKDDIARNTPTPIISGTQVYLSTPDTQPEAEAEVKKPGRPASQSK